MPFDLDVAIRATRPEDERLAEAANACLHHLILTDLTAKQLLAMLTAEAIAEAEHALLFGDTPRTEAPFRGILDGTEPLFGRRSPFSDKGRPAFED